MLVADRLRQLGGFGTAQELRATHTKRELAAALADDSIRRRRRGHYELPVVADHLAQAVAMTATLSHVSAAQHHGWRVKMVPEKAWVTVRRKRRLRPGDRIPVVAHFVDLPPDDVRGGVTTPLRTVLDCARALPFDEALAIADSALRARAVSPSALRNAAAAAHGPGSAAARLVARHADGRAANPFESVLRALCITEGLHLIPQLQIADLGLYAVVDLGDPDAKLVVEADGFEFHGTREGLRRDTRRYTELVIHGWTVLRYCFEDVMYRPDWVRWTLRCYLATRDGRDIGQPPSRDIRAA